jgi:hypothetical protein
VSGGAQTYLGAAQDRARADKEKKKQAVVTSLDIKVGEYILPFYAIFNLVT